MLESLYKTLNDFDRTLESFGGTFSCLDRERSCLYREIFSFGEVNYLLDRRWEKSPIYTYYLNK